MTALLDVQARFQDFLLNGGDGFLDLICDTSKENRRVLAGAYYDAYRLRLIEVLDNDFPNLHGLIGDDSFLELAAGYTAAHPSTSENARWFGRHMTDYLRTNELYASQPVVGELAAFEWALGEAFDAPDSDTLVAETLENMASDDWPGLVFTLGGAVRRLPLSTNAPDIWQALDGEQVPPSVETVYASVTWLVWRRDFSAIYRALDLDEARALDLLASGKTFTEVCEGLCEFHPPDMASMRAAGCLQQWIADGLIASVAT